MFCSYFTTIKMIGFLVVGGVFFLNIGMLNFYSFLKRTTDGRKNILKQTYFKSLIV